MRTSSFVLVTSVPRLHWLGVSFEPSFTARTNISDRSYKVIVFTYLEVPDRELSDFIEAYQGSVDAKPALVCKNIRIAWRHIL